MPYLTAAVKGWLPIPPTEMAALSIVMTQIVKLSCKNTSLCLILIYWVIWQKFVYLSSFITIECPTKAHTFKCYCTGRQILDYRCRYLPILLHQDGVKW